MKHLIRATYVAHLPQRGRQGVGGGKRCPFPSAETQTLLSLRTFPLIGESPKGEGKSGASGALAKGEGKEWGGVAHTTNVVNVHSFVILNGA